MNRLLIIFVFTISIFNHTKGQKITFDPVDWTSDAPVTIKVDFNGTAFYGYTGDLYLWSWTTMGSGQNINNPNNGSWASSNATSKFTDLGGNIRIITITPTTYFGLGKEILDVTGMNFLIKKLNGDDNGSSVPGKTQDYTNIQAKNETGILPNTNWAANKCIKIVADVTGTALAGSSGPLYYWGWYNNDGGDINSPNNGSWNNSSSASIMTRIGTSNVWYINLTPTTYFNTTASNLTSSTIKGLIKQQDGSNGQTANFGTFNNYVIYQKNASNVTISPANPPDNVPVTITFTAADNLLNNSSSVFFHSGIVTDGLSSTTWNNTQGVWADSTSVGKMTKISSNVYQITLPSIRSYYAMTSGQTAYKIMAVFRNADGTLQEKDGTVDYQFPLTLNRYLDVREPSGTFITENLNSAFRITGYTNVSSNLTIKVNGAVVKTDNSANRTSVLYTPTAAGTYSVTIEADNGSSIISKSFTVVVCGNSTQLLSMPAGLVYGINYGTDNTKATLVLHAPTENINKVYLIGDFNNWTVDCNYLMNYDNVNKVFWKEISSLTPAKEYVFQYLIDGKTRIGDPYADKVSDPWNDASIPSATYPGLIQYPVGATSINGETPTIATVLQTNQTPYSWGANNYVRIAQDKLNIYQLHFRDFTTEGTYLASIGKLDYLKRMGVNAIETLPVSEFEGNDSWGYNPNYYFAPDKAYGTKNDYKKFVEECHKRCIAVLGDMVLNHAFGTNPHARMYWDDLNNRPATNNPWFNAVSNFSNPAAQWGNDFNHESSHTKAFVDRVVTYWLQEYKIDGIRFDFTKGFGNTPYPNASCTDQWGGCYDASRIALLKRLADKMWSISNGTLGAVPYVVFEHLAADAENTELANYGNGIMMWSGVNPNSKYMEVAMGWPPTGSDPYKTDLSSVYYKNKGFAKPVWVSYIESHDEERIAYKQTQYGNGTAQTDLGVRSLFLQNAAVMNLLFRGPRQLWEFAELGYDYSINYNGRTGRKPIRWDYYDMTERKKIYEVYSRLFWLRNQLPKTFHADFDEPTSTKTDLVSQFKRFHFYNAVGDTAVTVIANTANSAITGNPDFNGSTTSQWYEFFTNTWQTVSNSMTLQAGEYRIYFNKKPQMLSPTLTLTSIVTNPVGSDTTSLLVTFNEPILNYISGSFLGSTISTSDLSSIFKLKNASNTLIPLSGTFNIKNNQFRLKSTNKLSTGNYTLNIDPNVVQNYGGLVLDNATTLPFSVLGSPLYVDLINFSGQKIENNVQLNWITANETNADKFEILRSDNAKNFESIGTIKAHGNSSSNIQYTFADTNPLAEAYYRLKSIDFDGSVQLSNIIYIKSDIESKIKLGPNPTLPRKLNIYNAQEISKIELFNTEGVNLNVNYQKQDNQIFIEFANELKAGLYVLKIQNANLKIQEFKIVIN